MKFQTYRPGAIAIDCDKENFQINGGFGVGKPLYEWVRTPWELHETLFEKAKEVVVNNGVSVVSNVEANKAV